MTAATSFATLAEPSAANITRTLDIVLHDHLQAQAAATALLIEAAETAGHGANYIEDALAQIAWRSPIRRIDVTTEDGPSYSSERTPLEPTELEPAFAALAAIPATGRTARRRGHRDRGRPDQGRRRATHAPAGRRPNRTAARQPLGRARARTEAPTTAPPAIWPASRPPPSRA